jgi:hypothetical protein
MATLAVPTTRAVLRPAAAVRRPEHERVLDHLRLAAPRRAGQVRTRDVGSRVAATIEHVRRRPITPTVARALRPFVDPAKGTATALILITTALAAAGLNAVVAGRPAGWIPTIAATVLLPADAWAVRRFIRSVQAEDRPTLPDPGQPPAPEPGSNVRVLPPRADRA